MSRNLTTARAIALSLPLVTRAVIPARADDIPPPAQPKATAPTDLDLADLLRGRAMSVSGGTSPGCHSSRSASWDSGCSSPRHSLPGSDRSSRSVTGGTRPGCGSSTTS